MGEEMRSSPRFLPVLFFSASFRLDHRINMAGSGFLGPFRLSTMEVLGQGLSARELGPVRIAC